MPQLGGISGNQPAQHCYALKTVLAARNLAKIPSFVSIFDMKKYFDKVVAWDRNLARKFQDKFNLTDYQMLCVAFAKGFVIGAILL